MQLALALFVVFGCLLIGAPVWLSATSQPLAPVPASIMLMTGVLLIILCASLLVMTKLYIRTRADEAFVRTGMGGLKVVRDGGALVLPVLHQIVRVSLATIRLEVERKGLDALITSDKLRADIKAEFFVRVQPEDAAIQNAARSLGGRMTEEVESRRGGGGYHNAVTTLIEDKLVSALRTASARKSLEQLNSDREEFLKEVVAMVTSDLAHNGFTLESVTISKLDQTDQANLKENNIFDAQGLRTIAEITQAQLTQRNEILRKGEQERTAQDVATRQQILALEQTKAEAEATQATRVASIRAEQARIAQEKQIEAERSVQAAQVEQSRLIQLAQQGQQRDITVAEQDRLKALTEAQQKVEVAKRAQEKAIAEAEAGRAIAQAKLAEAEAERTKAQQAVVTAEQVAAAERDKQKSVIAATATAEQAYVRDSKAADAAAYRVQAEAEARKAAADAEALAIRKKAEADAEAMRLRADGERQVALAKAAAEQAALEAKAAGQRAIDMVPVDVAARQVEVDKTRVETVLMPELEAREKSGKAAQEFELAQLRIQAEKEVRVEGARVMATVLNKVTANVYGTPEDVARMTQAFTNGMGAANLAAGFLDGAHNHTQLAALLAKVGGFAENLGQSTAERLSQTNSTRGAHGNDAERRAE